MNERFDVRIEYARLFFFGQNLNFLCQLFSQELSQLTILIMINFEFIILEEYMRSEVFSGERVSDPLTLRMKESQN